MSILPQELNNHIKLAAEGNLVCDNLHQADASSLVSIAFGVREDLKTELIQNVEPADLTIGGIAVSNMVHSTRHERAKTLDLGELIDGPSEGSATLHCWATDDLTSIVHISMQRTWRGFNPAYSPDIKRLADQVRSVPDIDTRAAEIAGLISLTSAVILENYAVDDDSLLSDDTLQVVVDGGPKKTIIADDESMSFDARLLLTEAELLARSKRGWVHIGRNLPQGRRPTMLEAAQLAIDSYRVQDDAQLTDEELMLASSQHVHGKLRDLGKMIKSLEWGLELARNGRRLHPVTSH